MLRKYHYDVVSCLRSMCSSTVSTMPAGMSQDRLPLAAAPVTVAAAADCGTTTPALICLRTARPPYSSPVAATAGAAVSASASAPATAPCVLPPLMAPIEATVQAAAGDIIALLWLHRR